MIRINEHYGFKQSAHGWDIMHSGHPFERKTKDGSTYIDNEPEFKNISFHASLEQCVNKLVHLLQGQHDGDLTSLIEHTKALRAEFSAKVYEFYKGEK
jgi:hypothetical protein